MIQVFTLFLCVFLLGFLVLGWYRTQVQQAFRIDNTAIMDILNAADLSVAKLVIAVCDLPLVWDEEEKSFVTPWEDQ